MERTFLEVIMTAARLVFVSQVKAYSKPPPLVEFVMAAVMTMMGKGSDWATAKKALGESNFLQQVRTAPITGVPTCSSKIQRVHCHMRTDSSLPFLSKLPCVCSAEAQDNELATRINHK